MANVVTDANGARRINFYDAKGARRQLRLGQISEREADEVNRQVGLIVDAQLRGVAPPVKTSLWLARQSTDTIRRLAKFGLCESREPVCETLASFLASYIAARCDVKGSTAVTYKYAAGCLVSYFGAEKPLASISLADADDYRRWLVTDQKLAANTANRRSRTAQQFFRHAVRKRLLTENPFGELKGLSVRANRSRDYFLTRADAAKVLDACPNAEWRLIFALSRFGGLRCPSETLALRWADVDWTAGRMTVHAAKTEHHEGKATRVVPLFPELRPLLEDAFDPTSEFVVNQYRDPGQNLRTQFERIIRRAGLQPWEKLFQNLRATRQTELAEVFPAHVVCDWIGNSQVVAREHYLQVTEDHFAAASGAPKVAQQPHASRCNALQGVPAISESPRKSLLSSDSGANQLARKAENLSTNPEGYGAGDSGHAASTAILPDLAEVVKAWPALTDHVRASIVATVRAEAPNARG